MLEDFCVFYYFLYYSFQDGKKEKDPLMSIRSETQRMIREGRISLPYHQPKQHTLHEFLQRRKAAPSIPLKATSDVLEIVWYVNL